MNLDETKLATTHHFEHPQAGDRFHEMYSFWVHVVLVAQNRIVVEEYSPPCTVPDDAKVRIFMSLAEFQEAYMFGSKHGPYVYYCDNNAMISHWKPTA